MIRTNKDLSSENKIIYVYFLSSARKASLTLHSALCTLHSKFCPLFYFPLIISRSFCAFSNISPPLA